MDYYIRRDLRAPKAHFRFVSIAERGIQQSK